MSFVSFRTVAPFVEMTVNPDKVLAYIPEKTQGVLVGRDRRIVVLEREDDVVRKIGSHFRRLDAVSTTYDTIYLNRDLVSDWSRHPQRSDVTFVMIDTQRFAIKGAPKDVGDRLA